MTISVCIGSACHLKGSYNVINSLQECYDTVRSNRAELDVPEADSSDYNYDSQNGSDQ